MNVNRKEKDTGSKVIFENGKIKTILSEEVINNGGFMDLDEALRLTLEELELEEKHFMNGKQIPVYMNHYVKHYKIIKK